MSRRKILHSTLQCFSGSCLLLYYAVPASVFLRLPSYFYFNFPLSDPGYVAGTKSAPIMPILHQWHPQMSVLVSHGLRKIFKLAPQLHVLDIPLPCSASTCSTIQLVNVVSEEPHWHLWNDLCCMGSISSNSRLSVLSTWHGTSFAPFYDSTI